MTLGMIYMLLKLLVLIFWTLLLVYLILPGLRTKLSLSKLALLGIFLQNFNVLLISFTVLETMHTSFYELYYF
jgi:hypothetical protein